MLICLMYQKKYFKQILEIHYVGFKLMTFILFTENMSSETIHYLIEVK